MDEITPGAVLARYRKAKDRRDLWEPLWQECYDYGLPQRDGTLQVSRPGSSKMEKLFDGTAPDAVDQLAASLLSQLTPPWARWFGLTAGVTVPEQDRVPLASALEEVVSVLQSHFDRSNFAVEVHQCYLDLVTIGTATLMFEEAPPGAESAFRFMAVPAGQVAFEEDASGRLETTFRRSELTLPQFKERFPDAKLPDEFKQAQHPPSGGGGLDGHAGTDQMISVIEAVVPGKGGYKYLAVLEPGGGFAAEAQVLAKGTFSHSPFINFRWLKAPGEVFGRSPVMKALPDIKTANKVVELVLKNASIAVTGIWQAEDDGVLNPANISLVPGTIIPKAVGSRGLTPLETPGRFDISQLVLDDLRARIRQALLADKLGQINDPRMTATEVLERAADMARLLGATYGRLQAELLTPLVMRAIAILRRRGEIPDIRVDGRAIDLEYKSPLARRQAQEDAQNTLTWLGAVRGLGPEALAIIDSRAAALWLARAFGVPGDLIREQPDGTEATDPTEDLLALGDALINGTGGAGQAVVDAVAGGLEGAPAVQAPGPDVVANTLAGLADAGGITLIPEGGDGTR